MRKQTILISGCSSGIGRDLAAHLARAGHTVVASARNPASLADLPVALRLALDVTDQASVDAAVQSVVERFGCIDVLVNNAGHSVRAAVEETDEALAKAMFEVNVWGLLRLTKAVLPQLRRQGRGRIVHIGSVVGRFTYPLNGAYAASKHAVEALADAQRVELRGTGIEVVLVEPGTINTGFMESSQARSQERMGNPDSPYAALYRRFGTMAASPGRKGADPARVSRVVQRAIEARRPRPRYLAAVAADYRLMLRLGDRPRDALQARVFGIGRAGAGQPG
jgi:NAD(P)-dependent dehydrogenase (short-subunit alcohol dehydrogenase family)